MAHIVTNKCVGCKFTDCVEVCPVACFYELDGQLVIHAEDCIDCTACVAECPVEAIYADSALQGRRPAGDHREERPLAHRREAKSRTRLLTRAALVRPPRHRRRPTSHPLLA